MKKEPKKKKIDEEKIKEFMNEASDAVTRTLSENLKIPFILGLSFPYPQEKEGEQALATLVSGNMKGPKIVATVILTLMEQFPEAEKIVLQRKIDIITRAFNLASVVPAGRG